MATTIDVSEDAPPTSLSRDDIGSDDQSVIQAQALSGAVNLYSGNISTTLTRTAFSQVGVSNGGDVMGQTYRYDLLNRFVSSRAATGESVDAVSGMSGSDYAVTVGYDANSNITALSRTMAQGLQLDQMTYKYATEVKEGQVFKLNNRLLHINDAVTTPDLATDMEDQGSFSLTNPQSWNYQYDANGRIISNRHDGVALIEYNAYGKVKRVVPTDDSRPTLEYTYDATQQRLSKKVIDADGRTTATYYAYDAMGVPMATYTHRETSESSTLTLNDFLLYGSGRLGSYQVNEPAGGAAPVPLVAANLRFELTDHLGTVRAVVTGQKTGTGNAEIVSLTDYYPYGMDMPGRSFQSEAYRYGYQGSERDPEMSGGAGYTTYFRALDPRIGRWLTPDPKVFPWQSPYVSMDGNPMALIDPWGDEGDGPEKGVGQGTNPLGDGEEVIVAAKMPEKNFNDVVTSTETSSLGACIFTYNQGMERAIGDDKFKAPSAYPNFNKTTSAINESGYIASTTDIYPVNPETNKEMNAGETKEYYEETKRVPLNKRPSRYIKDLIGDEKGKYVFGAGPGQGYHTVIITYDNTGDKPRYGIGDQGTGWTETDGYRVFDNRSDFDKKIMSMIKTAAVIYSTANEDKNRKAYPTASVRTTLYLIKPYKLTKLKSLGVKSIKLE